MAKYVQPNFIVDSSAAFLRNVTFDSSVYLQGVTHINTPSAVSVGTPYALVLENGSGDDQQVKSKQLGTMAFETSTNYYSKGMVDVIVSDLSTLLDTRLDYMDTSIAYLNTQVQQLDASIVRIDTSLNDTIDLYEAINASLGEYVKKSGDTMTGLLNLATAGFSLDSVTITNIDTSAEGLVTTNAGIPTSGAVKKYVDAQIGAGAAYGWNGLTKTDNSIGLGGTLNTGATVLTTNGATASLQIAGLATSTLNTALALVQDSANGDLKVRALGSMAWETSTNYYGKTQVDGLISDLSTLLDTRLDNIDTSITGIWTKFGHVDTSLNNIWTKLGYVDTSLSILNGWNVSQDASIVTLRNTTLSALQTANNGLTAGDTSVALGGALTHDTDIDATGYTFSVTGGLSVYGNLTVDGSVTYVKSVDLNVSDNIITVNYGETGAGVSKGYAGLKVDRGTEDDYVFVFAEATDTFRIGIANESGLPTGTQAVATREDTPTGYGVPFWNGSDFIFNTSSGFTFTPGTGLGLPIATNMDSEATALVWNGTTVGSRELGSNAFNSDAYVLQSLFDTSVAAIWTKFGSVDTSIAGLDTLTQTHTADIGYLEASVGALDLLTQNHTQSITDLSTNRLKDVRNINVTANASIYSYEIDNVAYLKKLVAGSGATITEDTSTITIAVTGVAGYVSKHSGTFDGTGGTQLIVTEASHGLGVGPLSVTVYDGTEQVYTGVDCAANGDITLTWSSGSLSSSCKYIIMG